MGGKDRATLITRGSDTLWGTDDDDDKNATNDVTQQQYTGATSTWTRPGWGSDDTTRRRNGDALKATTATILPQPSFRSRDFYVDLLTKNGAQGRGGRRRRRHGRYGAAREGRGSTDRHGDRAAAAPTATTAPATTHGLTTTAGFHDDDRPRDLLSRLFFFFFFCQFCGTHANFFANFETLTKVFYFATYFLPPIPNEARPSHKMLSPTPTALDPTASANNRRR
jgi:hypothetical protein